MNRKINNDSKARLYRIYNNMKNRCYNQNDISYKYYGRKGIAICKEWLDDFANFYNWAIENGYRDDLSIDRKESDKDYSPNNCRWIPLIENVRRAKGQMLDNAITRIRQLANLSQKKFCEKYGIPLQTLCKWEQGYRTCPDYVTELLEFKVRKDIPQEIIHKNDHVGNVFRCPHCGYGFFDTMAWLRDFQYLCMDYKYCYNCGNKIQWRNVRKEMEGFSK